MLSLELVAFNKLKDLNLNKKTKKTKKHTQKKQRSLCWSYTFHAEWR